MPTTPNMDLVLPVPTETPGPTWASELNSALDRVDLHDHTANLGVPVPTAGMNIDEDLSFNQYNATSVRSVRFVDPESSLGDPNDLACVYAAGGNLFFNDSSGVRIQLTAGGALNAASIGGIGGDYATSDASVYYQTIDDTFYFTSDTNVPATINMGSAIIREPVLNSNRITLKSPTSLGASYDITLPSAVPASSRVLSMSSTGALSAGATGIIVASDMGTSSVESAAIAPGAVTESKLQDQAVSTDKIANLAVTAAKIGSLAVTTAKIDNGAVTQGKLAAVPISTTSGSGTFSTTSATPVAVTNLNTNFTTTGRLVVMVLEAASAVTGAQLSATGAGGTIFLRRDSTVLGAFALGNSPMPPGGFTTSTVAAAGNYNYNVQAKSATGVETVSVTQVQLKVYEL